MRWMRFRPRGTLRDVAWCVSGRLSCEADQSFRCHRNPGAIQLAWRRARGVVLPGDRSPSQRRPPLELPPVTSPQTIRPPSILALRVQHCWTGSGASTTSQNRGRSSASTQWPSPDATAPCTGPWRSSQAVAAKGMKPMVGVETYVARREHARQGRQGRQPALPSRAAGREWEGYKNLCRLITDAHLDGYYYKASHRPRHPGQVSKGLIGSSACLVAR